MSFSHARLTFSHAGIAPRIAIRAGHAYIADMKKIGFLSFGHWTPSPQSQARSAADVLLQSIDLAVAAEQLGAAMTGANTPENATTVDAQEEAAR